MKTKRAKIDPMITMINVVFLLIAFFLFGQFQKPAPISLSLPFSTTSEPSVMSEIIYIDEEGKIYLGDEEGDEALALATSKKAQYQIHVDENTPVNVLINALGKLRTIGIDVMDLGVQK